MSAFVSKNISIINHYEKTVFFLLLSVLLSIPLSTKVTIVDDPGVFNFSPFYDPASGVIGLSLTFFPSEEGDTVYIPDYIYENIALTQALFLTAMQNTFVCQTTLDLSGTTLSTIVAS